METINWFLYETWYGIITFSVALIALLVVFFVVRNKKSED
jgi:hypothetical protein